MSQYVSEHLKAVISRLSEHDHEGIVLSSEDLRAFVSRLRQIAGYAVELEQEVSRHRWNIKVRAEREAREQLDVAVAADNSNVMRFPARRPIGGDAA